MRDILGQVHGNPGHHWIESDFFTIYFFFMVGHSLQVLLLQ